MKNKVLIIAEVGINHNGDIELAKKLIAGAKWAGADAVKFQKRNISSVYSKEYLEKYRESPWGVSNREQKEGLEFDKAEYDIIDKFCKEQRIPWFASAWDLKSLKFLEQYDLPYNKIASPLLTHKQLLLEVAKQKKYTFISTGMSTLDEITYAVSLFKGHECHFELMHCNSQYPMPDEKANLKIIPYFKRLFLCDVGYSGHEVGLVVSAAAVAIGASSIERHITLNRTMYGSDQASSVEVEGFRKLVKYIRAIEECLGNGVKTITAEEQEARQKLGRDFDYEC